MINLGNFIFIFIYFNKIWFNNINNFRIHIIENNKYLNYFVIFLNINYFDINLLLNFNQRIIIKKKHILFIIRDL